MAANTLNTPHIVSRVIASLVGSYAFVWGFVALGITLSVTAGMSYEEAFTLTKLLAFLLFLGLFCWTFVCSSLTRVWLVLIGGGAVMAGAAWLLQKAMLVLVI